MWYVFLWGGTEMLEYGTEYTISEVSDLTGYAPHVLRYYEKEFQIEVPRNGSNHRYYTVKEIELIQYIKMLQDKGFNNKQIKLIINSEELIVSNPNNTSMDLANNKSNDLDTNALALEISNSLEENFFNKLEELIENTKFDNINMVEELKSEIMLLRNELNSKERDILICENAKLKMKLKERTYENIELNKKLSKYENKNGNFLKRIFAKNK